MPRPNQTLFVPSRRAFSLRAACAPTCRLKIVSWFATFALKSSFMLKLHEATDESALHLRQHRANALLLLVQAEKLPLHGLVEFVEVRPADGITHRDQNIHARLDQHPLIDSQIDLAFRLRFIGQNSWCQSRRAVESVRQESKEPWSVWATIRFTPFFSAKTWKGRR